MKNKKNLMMKISIIFLCCCFSSNHVFAAPADAPVYYCLLQIDNNNYMMSFWEQTEVFRLDENDSSVKPILHEGRTMLPMRAFSRLLNFDGPMYYDVEWYDSERKAVLCMRDDSDPAFYQVIAEFWIGRSTAVYYDDNGANPRQVTIPCAPIIVNSRTYLPLRAVADAISSFEIEWVSSRRGIVLYLSYDGPRDVSFADWSKIGS